MLTFTIVLMSHDETLQMITHPLYIQLTASSHFRTLIQVQGSIYSEMVAFVRARMALSVVRANTLLL